MHLYYATRDGQSRRIAAHIAGRLAEAGIAAAPHDLAQSIPDPAMIAREPVAVVVMAVRYGKHLPEGQQFISAYGALSAPPPLALASVNLTARKAGKDTAAGNAYLRKLIAANRLKPALATAFAGRLDYPRYGFFDRQVIRFIMWLTGGPTDPSAVVEYTSWPAVDAFAARIAERCSTSNSAT